MFSGKSSILEHDHHLLTSAIPSANSQGVVLKSRIFFSFFFYFKGFGDSFLVVGFFVFTEIHCKKLVINCSHLNGGGMGTICISSCTYFSC